MKLKFNIIYTPDSVAQLHVLVLSLLEHTDFEFRLVSNGCKRAEAKRLEAFCDTNDRLEYYHYITMPTRQLREWKQAPHGMVLNKLQRMETSDYFAFLDSDLFAIGELTTETILTDLKGHAAVCSGSPLWATASDQTAPSRPNRFNDPQNVTDTGLCIGSSYFAVYDNRILTAVMKSSKAKFDVYRKQTSVQKRNHATVERLDVGAEIYDTGKYLNIVLQANGHPVRMRNEYPVRHIGGMSFWHIGHEHRVTEPWIPRKHASQRFFGELMRSLSDGTKFDAELEIEDATVRELIFDAAKHLEALYRRHGIGF